MPSQVTFSGFPASPVEQLKQLLYVDEVRLNNPGFSQFM